MLLSPRTLLILMGTVVALVLFAAPASAATHEVQPGERRSFDRARQHERRQMGRVPVLDGDGQVLCRFGTATDIDDRKRSEH